MCFVFLLIYWKYIWEIFNGVFIEGVLSRLESPHCWPELRGVGGRTPSTSSHKHNHRVGGAGTSLKCWMTSLPPCPLTRSSTSFFSSPAKEARRIPLVASHLFKGRRTTLTLLFQKDKKLIVFIQSC